MNEHCLLEQLEKLPKEREPGPDLWPAIRRRIAPSRLAVMRTKPWFDAVAAALLVGFALTLGMQLGDNIGKIPGSDANSDFELAPLQSSTGQFIAGVLDIEYGAALRDVVGHFKAEPQAAPDPQDAGLSQSLKILQNATEDLRDALEQDPNSIYLAELLASTHRKRINLLRDLALAQVDAIKLNLRRT